MILDLGVLIYRHRFSKEFLSLGRAGQSQIPLRKERNDRGLSLNHCRTQKKQNHHSLSNQAGREQRVLPKSQSLERMSTVSHYRIGGATEGEDRSEKEKREVLSESQSSRKNENHQSTETMGEGGLLCNHSMERQRKKRIGELLIIPDVMAMLYVC
jgi:hypothetical protein